MTPLFSVIIPTKYRPQMIRFALYSLSKQIYQNFEVIITDDFDEESCLSVVQSFSDNRFRYVSPPKELGLGMCGNWEYGLQFARGKYIIFLQDKMFFYSDALEYLSDVIEKTEYPDLLNWSWDYYVLRNEGVHDHGYLFGKVRHGGVLKTSGLTEIKKKIEFAKYTYQNESGAPGMGSPLCGAVKREIYEHLKKEYGCVFNFINPDYGPPILLLNQADKIYEILDNLTVLIPSMTSEGAKHCDYEKALSFLDKSPCGRERLKYAVVPLMHVTNSNMVSADYNYSLKLVGLDKEVGLCNENNVIKSILKELRYATFPTKKIEREELDKIRKKCKVYGIKYEILSEEENWFAKVKLYIRQLLPDKILFVYLNLRYKGKCFWEEFESPFEIF